VARMGVWGKGQQSIAPPQHELTPEREERSDSEPCGIKFSGLRINLPFGTLIVPKTNFSESELLFSQE